MRKFILFGLSAWLLVFGAACTPETPLPPTPSSRAVPGVDTLVKNPTDGAVLNLGTNSITTVAISSRCCLTNMRLLVNGRSISSHAITTMIASSSQTFSWTPSSAGEYYLQSQATLTTGDIAVSQAVRVCVFSNYNPVPDAGGYLGPCAIPTRLPSAAASGTAAISALISPNPITIFPVSCGGTLHPTFTINATVNDPADQVFMVEGYLGIGSDDLTFYLNWYASEPGGVKMFHGTYTPVEDISSYTRIYWNATALDRRGFLVVASPLADFPVYQGACRLEQAATPGLLQIIPSATPGNLIASIQAYPSPIYYGNTCPSVSNLSFRAALLLPNGTDAKQVQVLAHANVNGADGNPAGSLTVPLMSDGTFDTASGGQVFLGSLDLSHSYNDTNNEFDPASLGGANGSLHWYITVANQSTEMGRSAKQILNLAPCPTYAKPTSQSSSGNTTCTKTQAYCSQLNEKLDTGTCSCVP